MSFTWKFSTLVSPDLALWSVASFPFLQIPFSTMSCFFSHTCSKNPSPRSNQWLTSAVTPRLLRAAGESHTARQCSSITDSSSEAQLILEYHLCVHITFYFQNSIVLLESLTYASSTTPFLSSNDSFQFLREESTRQEVTQYPASSPPCPWWCLSMVCFSPITINQSSSAANNQRFYFASRLLLLPQRPGFRNYLFSLWYILSPLLC